ncbi:MAG: T9SS type A sorting domain-containing protein, partial [Bacteroidales bacterium]|nr:T9SS type A sorting domain-containing protein [Bacteroidales bacterium]
NYYFILDSNRTSNYDDFLDADWLGTYLEVNNLKVRNSYIPSSLIWGDKVVVNNCEFTNDTIDGTFIGIDENGYNELKLINCTFSQNIFYREFIYQEYYYMKLTMENTTVSGNTFDDDYPAYFEKATVNLTSGSWRNNNLSANYYYNNNANLSTQNCAGIWAKDSVVINIGSGFTMDANNYICLDTTATVNITENITAPLVAQVYPFKYDNNSGYYIADYYEGRRLLTGSASMLRANYQKFSVAQADNASLWYLHPDGTIHTFPVSIDQAEEGTISLYPNPASNVLNIALQGTEVNEVAVIDIYGKTALRANVAEGSNTLDISALPAGMYFVQLRAAGSVKATQKLIKK